MWESRIPPSGRLGGPMVPNIVPASGEIPPLAAFANIAQNMKEGLPLTPWGAEVRRQRMASNSKDNPDANCLPIGFMQLRVNWRLGAEEELIEFICNENERDSKHYGK